MIAVSGHTFVHVRSLAPPALWLVDPPGVSAGAVWARAQNVTGCIVAAVLPREWRDIYRGIAFIVLFPWTQV